MKETIEHNNRFYGEELKTESEQLKEWLIVANKEIERLNKARKTDIEYNKYLQKEIIRLNNIIKDINKILKDDDLCHIEKLQEIHKLVGSESNE